MVNVNKRQSEMGGYLCRWSSTDDGQDLLPPVGRSINSIVEVHKTVIVQLATRRPT